MGQAIGARDYNDAQDSLHTAMLTGLIGGIIMIFVGQVVSRPMLELMQTPDDVIELSSLYMKIYFMGMPGFMLYLSLIHI